MKKILTVVLALLLLCSSCLAEGLDYASMTDTQLHDIVDAARNELTKRELVAEGKTLLFERNGVSVYLTSDFKADSFHTDSMHFMRASVIVVNDSDINVRVGVESMSVNGWEVSNSGFSSVSPGKKLKDELTFNAVDTDITTVEEIETIEITFRLSNADTYMFFADVPAITLHFNVQ